MKPFEYYLFFSMESRDLARKGASPLHAEYSCQENGILDTYYIAFVN